MGLRLIYSVNESSDGLKKAYEKALSYREVFEGRKLTVKEKQQLRKDIKRVYSSDIKRV